MKLTASDLAFGEATQNLHNAEQFFNAGSIDKAYCAAYIASVWSSLGTALHMKESMPSRGELLPWAVGPSTAETAPLDPPVMEALDAVGHQHSHNCDHDWQRNPLDDNDLQCANHCETTYHQPTAQWPCPEKCPMWKKMP